MGLGEPVPMGICMHIPEIRCPNCAPRMGECARCGGVLTGGHTCSPMRAAEDVLKFIFERNEEVKEKTNTERHEEKLLENPEVCVELVKLVQEDNAEFEKFTKNVAAILRSKLTDKKKVGLVEEQLGLLNIRRAI